MAVEVKICGLTNSRDAAVAVEAGASYLGVVFASGPRRVGASEARDVVAASSGRPVFGVFGGQSAEEILEMTSSTGLAGAQLHTAVIPAIVARLRAEGLLVWGAARLRSERDLPVLADLPALDAVLVEPRTDGAEGGAGVPLDHALGRAARLALTGRRMALAGGLRPETVGAAIAAVRPDIVDVSSGIEASPGRKDAARVRLFLEAVRGDQPSP